MGGPSRCGVIRSAWCLPPMGGRGLAEVQGCLVQKLWEKASTPRSIREDKQEQQDPFKEVPVQRQELEPYAAVMGAPTLSE